MIETPTLRSQALSLIHSLLQDKIITSQDLAPFVRDTGHPTDGEYVRQEMETWYRTLGIEGVLKRPFALTKPPFTAEELQEAHDHNELILCVPRGVTSRQLGILFNLRTWAQSDELVSNATEVEDFWFKTKRSTTPDYCNRTGHEISKIFEREGKLTMSLNRYMTFVARMRYLTGQTPDLKYRVWLHRERYEGKGVLVAGFDSNEKFTVHGWLPQFHGKYCGARYVSIPDHL